MSKDKDIVDNQQISLGLLGVAAFMVGSLAIACLSLWLVKQKLNLRYETSN